MSVRHRGQTSNRFKHAGQFAAQPMKRASEQFGFAQARLVADWEVVVGPELAAKVRPVKVGYARGGFGATLTVSCRSAHAPEVEMASPVIRERVNACYGYNAISRIRVTQGGATTGLAEGQAAFTGAPKPTGQAEPSAEMLEQVGAVHDTDLRAALARLGANIERTNSHKGKAR